MLEPARVMQFPVLDRDAAQTFLQFLDPETDKFTFQTFTDSEQKKKSYKGHPGTKRPFDPLAKVLHGSLDEHWAQLADLSRQGAGVFVVVNRTTLTGRRNRENLVGVRAHFADCDGVPMEQIKAGVQALGLLPHIWVQTSEGKWHLYWCIDADDEALQTFGQVQRQVSELFESDPAVVDLPRVMRLPGFPHQKDGSKGYLVSLVHTYDGGNYTYSQFLTALDNALSRGDAETSRAELGSDIFGPPSTYWSTGCGEGRRNDECAKRAGSAIAGGATYEEAVERCLEWNKFNRPPLDEDEVRAVVDSIWKTHSRKQQANDQNKQAKNGSDKGLPLIEVKGGGLSDEATAGEKAIIGAGFPVYRRGAVSNRFQLRPPFRFQ